MNIEYTRKLIEGGIEPIIVPAKDTPLVAQHFHAIIDTTRSPLRGVVIPLDKQKKPDQEIEDLIDAELTVFLSSVE